MDKEIKTLTKITNSYTELKYAYNGIVRTYLKYALATHMSVLTLDIENCYINIPIN
jgi:hypothetical protein